MGAGLAAAIATGLIVFGAQHAGDSPEFILWRGPLIGLIGWPVIGLTLLLLAYRNYAKLQPDLRTWTRNAATLLAALLCVAAVTTTVYHRAWEAWLPEEPPHQFTSVRHNFIGQQRPATAGPARANRITQGYLGVSIQDLTPELAKGFKLEQTTGALVSYVSPNGPAEQAGLKAGDLVRRFEGKEISDSRQLGLAVAGAKPDSKVPIEIVRRGSTLTLEITLGQMPDLKWLAW